MAPRTPRSRTSRTKAELTDELNEVTTTSRSRETATAKDREQKTAHDSEVRKAVEGVTAEKVVNKVTQVSLDVNRTFQQVTEQLVQASQELDTIRAAIALEKEELERLHGVDVVASSIDSLLADYELRKQAQAEEENRTRQAWSDEHQLHLKQIADRNAETEKLRRREETDFTYAREQKRKQETDTWQESVRVAHSQERDRKEAFEKSLMERENAMQAREEEFAKLKLEVEMFPAKLDGEVKKAEAIVGNSVKRDFEHRIALMTKDHEAGRLVVESNSRNIQEQNQRLVNEVATLTQRLADANEKVANIAKEALTSAGNSRALAEITSFAERTAGNNGNRSKA